MSQHTRQRPPHLASDDERAPERPRGWRVVAEPSPSGWHGHLNPLARALGIENLGGTRLCFRVNGTPVRVALSLSEGDIVACTVTVSLEGPAAGPAPSILFREETDLDREGKALGIAREVQTGFEGFDHAVYVDNDASDADVHRFLEKEATRDAILDLLGQRDCRWLKVSRKELVASFSPDSDTARLVPALESLLAVARARAPRERGTGRRGRGWVVAPLLLGLAAVAGLYGATTRWPPADSGFIAVGSVAGLLLGSLLAPRLRRAVSGDAGSYKRFVVSLVGLLLSSAVAGAALAPTVNGALDWRQPLEVHGVVTSVGRVDRRSETVGVVVEWEGGGAGSADMAPPVARGMTVRQLRHPGALGVEWREPPTPCTRASGCVRPR